MNLQRYSVNPELLDRKHPDTLYPQPSTARCTPRPSLFWPTLPGRWTQSGWRISSGQ